MHVVSALLKKLIAIRVLCIQLCLFHVNGYSFPFHDLIVAKVLDGQRYPLPLCEYVLMCDGERGSGPEGADDLCSVSFADLGLKVSINNGI